MAVSEGDAAVLGYQPWQRRAAYERFAALSFAAVFALFGGNLLSLPLVVLLGLYAYATSLGPLLRFGLRVSLEPGGVRVGERFYPKERFAGLEGPLGPWTRWEVWPGVWSSYRFRLRLGWRFRTDPLFHLLFGEERVPLWLDFPGWDRMLAHLGLDWRKYPGLRRYLHTARGLAWLNGLLYPPVEAEGPWQEARVRYRRVCAWMWAGAGLGVSGFAFSLFALFLGANVWPVVGLAPLALGLVLLAYPFLTAFNFGRGRPGWAVAYNPLVPLEASLTGEKG